MIRYLREMVEGRKPKVSRSEVLGARPVRNPVVEWEHAPLRGAGEDGEEPPAVILLRVPRRNDRWGNFVARMFRLPSHRKIELDEMGSDVWERCDGTISVDALTRAICERYRLNRRQGETSVTAYLRMLAERRLIALLTSPAKAGKSEANKATKKKTLRKPA